MSAYIKSQTIFFVKSFLLNAVLGLFSAAEICGVFPLKIFFSYFFNQAPKAKSPK